MREWGTERQLDDSREEFVLRAVEWVGAERACGFEERLWFSFNCSYYNMYVLIGTTKWRETNQLQEE